MKINVSLTRVCNMSALSVVFLRWAGRMGEGPAVRPSAAITPMQQMLASGTGAVLTSLFGEKKNQHNHIQGLNSTDSLSFSACKAGNSCKYLNA